jgi:hypothetical protein
VIMRLILSCILAISAVNAHVDILDKIWPMLSTHHGMTALQFEADSTTSASAECLRQVAAYESICIMSSDSASCSGTTSCLRKKQRAFSAVVGSCGSSADVDILTNTARKYVSDMVQFALILYFLLIVVRRGNA